MRIGGPRKRSNNGRRNDVAAVTCVFSPAGFRRPYGNHQTFADAWERSSIPLYTVEVLLPGQAPQLMGDNVFHVLVQDAFFHKESAINYGVSRLPAEFTKVCWLDADMVWPDYDWALDLSRRLDDHPVIQLWSRLLDTDRNGHVYRDMIAYAARNYRSSPGGAWAGHRELWTHFGGLFDYWPTGGGDSLATAAFSGRDGDSVIQYCRQLMHDDVDAAFKKWAQPVTRYVRNQIGCVQAEPTHLWHGDRAGRQYGHRHKLLSGVDFARDIRRDCNGFLEWVNPKQSNAAAFMEFFKNRKEDG